MGHLRSHSVPIMPSDFFREFWISKFSKDLFPKYLAGLPSLLLDDSSNKQTNNAVEVSKNLWQYRRTKSFYISLKGFLHPDIWPQFLFIESDYAPGNKTLWHQSALHTRWYEFSFPLTNIGTHCWNFSLNCYLTLGFLASTASTYFFGGYWKG